MKTTIMPFDGIFKDNGDKTFSVLNITWIDARIHQPHFKIGRGFSYAGLPFPQLQDKTFEVQLRDDGAWAILRVVP